MTDTMYKEFRLFCPVCNTTFTQLVVIHKVPKNFKIEPYLAGMVENHDHKAFQATQAKAQENSAPLPDPEESGEA